MQVTQTGSIAARATEMARRLKGTPDDTDAQRREVETFIASIPRDPNATVNERAVASATASAYRMRQQREGYNLSRVLLAGLKTLPEPFPTVGVAVAAVTSEVSRHAPWDSKALAASLLAIPRYSESVAESALADLAIDTAEDFDAGRPAVCTLYPAVTMLSKNVSHMNSAAVEATYGLLAGHAVENSHGDDFKKEQTISPGSAAREVMSRVLASIEMNPDADDVSAMHASLYKDLSGRHFNESNPMQREALGIIAARCK